LYQKQKVALFNIGRVVFWLSWSLKMIMIGWP